MAIPGDIGADGIPDLILGDPGWNNSRGRLLAYLGMPIGFAGPVDSLQGTQAAFGALGLYLTAGADMDGDGRGDFTCYFSYHDTIVALFHPRPGDYFGDYELIHEWWGGLIPRVYQAGRPALALPCLEPQHGYSIYLGGHGLDTIPDAVLPIQDFFGGTPSYVGDVNDDGWGDWVAGHEGNFGGLGAFLLFLGGPWISNYSYWMRGALGNPYWAMGKAMTGVGDVNGDGIDDFAMLCARDTTGHEGSQLVVFAGSESLRLAVDEQIALPAKSPLLIEAFPNPAHGEVQVELVGLSQGAATIEVWNVLGQRVWRREVTVQTGRVDLVWPIEDTDGRKVAAGVYFVQVIQRGTALARQKILVAH
ncbi:MAG: T9SS type A sorting domain-containing protein [Calditrichaeota bacterium]|nr:T9SS type A sorting domain-containing protein [Calditrichota bacterium]